jgi:Tfp pilus assembly protein PilN
MVYDINLLPKNEKKNSGNPKGILIVIGTCSLLAFGILGYYFPASKQRHMENMIKEQEDEIAAYAETEEQYNTLTEQVMDTTLKSTSINSLKSSSLKLTKLLDDIEEYIPKKINVESMSCQDALLTIEALSPSYKEISCFIANVRKIENVQDVKFTSAAREEKNNGKKEIVTNRFTIYLSLNVEDAFSKLIAGEDNKDEGETAAEDTVSEDGAASDEAGADRGEADSDEAD